MVKLFKETPGNVALALGAGAIILALGGAITAFRVPGLLDHLPLVGQSEVTPEDLFTNQDLDANRESAVLALVSLPAEARQADLEAIANQAEASLERSRARYLLATDLLNQRQPQEALRWLQGLEAEYSPFAPYVLYQRARAYQALDQRAEALQTWQQLANDYPDDPVSVEALYAIGTTSSDTQYWDQAIANFPSHPRTLDMAQARLTSNPGQVDLLMILARYGLHLPNSGAVLNELVEDHGAALTPEDWEAIGFGYWEKQIYGRAGLAYALAAATPRNLYRAGRGAQLGDRTQDAIQAYQRLSETFPEASDTAQGLIHLASLTSSPQQAIAYLDIVRENFPDRAADALLARASRLEDLRSAESAQQARQSVLTQHSSSKAAATLRWQQVQRNLQANDRETAQAWAKQLLEENSDSDYAPEAAFWVARINQQSGNSQAAQAAYETILRNYPDSYYAWRAAIALGWDVGDFTSTRQKMVPIQIPPRHQTPLDGSEVLQELYWLGQDQDAWTRWQVEFRDRMEPTVTQQFTDGVMRLGVGDNLEGIFMVESLAWREDPEEQQQYRALRQQSAYWQARYPFLYDDLIQAWSSDRQLNPLLVVSLIRQESRFEPKIESVAGALGLMQVLPETADWIAAQSDDIGEFTMTDPNDNIKLGTWYLDYTHREYGNNSLLAIASYNAGPGSVANWLDRFGFSDPDLFVDQIPFPETKGYVESVFGNYWNYLRVYNPDLARRLASYSDEQAAMLDP
ncbi:MAG: tail length tape measure protein [Leptolyngbya sp. DLM2.Bin15]|nr:MAG: tail length tape measure protein [Leptolyngbya sp. DLM2.Bin15]